MREARREWKRGGGSALFVVSYCVGLSRVSEKTQFFLLDSFHSKRKERKHAIFKCCCCFQLHSNHNPIPMALFFSLSTGENFVLLLLLLHFICSFSKRRIEMAILLLLVAVPGLRCFALVVVVGLLVSLEITKGNRSKVMGRARLIIVVIIIYYGGGRWWSVAAAATERTEDRK